MGKKHKTIEDFVRETCEFPVQGEFHLSRLARKLADEPIESDEDDIHAELTALVLRKCADYIEVLERRRANG